MAGPRAMGGTGGAGPGVGPGGAGGRGGTVGVGFTGEPEGLKHQGAGER